MFILSAQPNGPLAVCGDQEAFRIGVCSKCRGGGAFGAVGPFGSAAMSTIFATFDQIPVGAILCVNSCFP